MSNYPRILDIDSILKRKSLFLFGPRQTGKSSFLRLNFPQAMYIDLLLNENFSLLIKNPELLRKKVELHLKTNKSNIVIVDEILRGAARQISGKERIKNAFFIIFAAYATVVAAMIPLFNAGAGLVRGFAITTIVGVSIGVFITRPAFSSFIEKLLSE